MSVSRIVWMRRFCDIDSLRVWSPKRSVAVAPAGELSARIGGHEFVFHCSDCQPEPAGVEQSNGRFHSGFAIDRQLYSQLRQVVGAGQERRMLFQKRADEDWNAFLRRSFESNVVFTLDDETTVSAAMARRSALIPLPGETFVDFFDATVQALCAATSKVQGWACTGDPGSDRCKLKVMFSLADSYDDVSSDWKFMGSEAISRLGRRYKFRRSLSPDFQYDEIGLRPQFYKRDGRLLRFDQIMLSMIPAEGKIEAELCLVTAGATNSSSRSTQVDGEFLGWDGDDRWKVMLEPPFDQEISIIPRMCFPGNRGSYTPPKKGDKLLVTLCHGQDPVGEYKVTRPQLHSSFENISTGLLGDVVAIIGNKESVVSADNRKLVTVEPDEVRIAQNLVVTPEEFRVGQRSFMGKAN